MKNPILGRSRPKTSVQDFEKEEIIAFLREKLTGSGVKEAYLFGSVALGNSNAWSDLDVMVIKDTDLPFLERARELGELFGLGVPVDILVYTPEEFKKLRESNSGFWKEFEQQKKRIM